MPNFSRKKYSYHHKKKKLFKLRQSAKKRKRRQKTHRPRQTHKIAVYGHIYSENCGFCVAMTDEWDELISSVSDVKLMDIGDNYDEKIASVNAEYKSDLAYEGLPTIYKISKIGANAEYFSGGERTANAMRKWLYTTNKSQ